MAFAARAIGTPAVVGYSGHLYPWKGVDLLLDALAELPGVRGLVVGGHPGGAATSARLQNRARASLACESRVTFTGMVRPREVAARLEPADVLVLPNPATVVSERYTSPLKLFEYLALGRPIVASDLPGVPRGRPPTARTPCSSRREARAALAAAVRAVHRRPRSSRPSIATARRSRRRATTRGTPAERLDACSARLPVGGPDERARMIAS